MTHSCFSWTIWEKSVFSNGSSIRRRCLKTLPEVSRSCSFSPSHRRFFILESPTLQKIGQIFARNPEVPFDLREALQVLENGLSTTSRDQVMDFILENIGPDTIEEYQVHCAAEVLAEATVGVVLPCTLVLPGETRVRQAVAKVIKPYAMSALQEELEIFDRLARYFAEYSDSYAVGTILISDMFDEISVALSQEIQVVDEQQNLAKAGAYYLANERVRVPELCGAKWSEVDTRQPTMYPLSTAHVTFMEFVHGHKISEAFPGQPQARARLARRLVDALTLDVLL